jgi:hypothetical protein
MDNDLTYERRGDIKEKESAQETCGGIYIFLQIKARFYSIFVDFSTI